MPHDIVDASKVGDGIWKYVVHSDGSARFAEFMLSGSCPKHSDIRIPGKVATAAGIIGVNGPDLVVASATSETLGIHGSIDADYAVLRKMIGGAK